MNTCASQSARSNYKQKPLLSPIDLKTEEPEYKYLPPFTRLSQEQLNPKWCECKIIGQNIFPRSNSAIGIIEDYLYIYGGYQYALGIMSDFYRLNIKNTIYQWEKLSTVNGPGPRCRHLVCVWKNKFYLFGGQIADSISTNNLYVYDQSWSKLEQNQTYPPQLDNHAGTLQNDEWIIFGGFEGGKQHSNKIFKYNFDINEWIYLIPETKQAPAPRDGSSITCLNDSMFMFGGKQGDLRFNDLWKFDLTRCIWNFLPIKSDTIPKARSGHSIIAFNNKLVLFGGIHDVTWELDDLLVYNPQISEWKIVDSDTSRQTDKVAFSPGTKSQAVSCRHKRNKKKILLRPLSLKRSPQHLSPPKDQWRSQSKDNSVCFTSSRNESRCTQKNISDTTVVTINNVVERKKQEFQRRKKAMLKLFEVKDKEAMKFQEDCVVTEKLKTSIIVIGNPKSDLKLKQGVLTEFGKPLISRFLQPIVSGQNTIFGKKPCARDGHSIVLHENILYVFGGDRHTMSFNDLYQLDLNLV